MKYQYLHIVLAALFLAVACGERDDRLEEWLGVDGPRAVGDKIVYLDKNFSELVAIDFSAGDVDPGWTRTAVESGSRIVGTLEAEEALVMHSAATGLLQLAYPGTGEVKELELEPTYDSFVLREDPPIVGAWHSANAKGGAETFITEGEFSLVNVGAAKDAVRTETPATYGGSPLGIDIADRVPYPDGGRLFAFVRWNAYITLLDVEKPDFGLVSIPLKPGDSVMTVTPGPMKFLTSDGALTAFFLAQGTSDLHAINVDVASLGPKGKGTSLQIFPTAAGASEFVLYRGADGEDRVLVLCTSARMAGVVHPASSEVKLYSLNFSPRNVMLFTMVSTETGVEEQFAFIYDDTGASQAYYFVELDRIQEKKSKAFHYYTLPAPVRKVYMMGQDSFLVVHSGSSKSVSRVSVADSSVISVDGGTITDELLSPDGGTLYALATSGTTAAVAAFELEEFLHRKVAVTHGQKPTGLLHLADKGLLVAFDANGYALTVIPDDFKAKDSSSVVEFFVPFLFGLEH
jgi:hypothetical protein